MAFALLDLRVDPLSACAGRGDRPDRDERWPSARRGGPNSMRPWNQPITFPAASRLDGGAQQLLFPAAEVSGAGDRARAQRPRDLAGGLCSVARGRHAGGGALSGRWPVRLHQRARGAARASGALPAVAGCAGWTRHVPERALPDGAFRDTARSRCRPRPRDRGPALGARRWEVGHVFDEQISSGHHPARCAHDVLADAVRADSCRRCLGRIAEERVHSFQREHLQKAAQARKRRSRRNGPVLHGPRSGAAHLVRGSAACRRARAP